MAISAHDNHIGVGFGNTVKNGITGADIFVTFDIIPGGDPVLAQIGQDFGADLGLVVGRPTPVCPD